MSKVETFSFFPESQIKSISRSLLSALTMQPYSFKSRFLSFRTTKSPGLNFSLTNLSLKLLIWFIRIWVWIRSTQDQVWFSDMPPPPPYLFWLGIWRYSGRVPRNFPIIPLLTFSLIWVKLKAYSCSYVRRIVFNSSNNLSTWIWNWTWRLNPFLD